MRIAIGSPTTEFGRVARGQAQSNSVANFFSILQRAYLEFERHATEPRSNRFKKIPLVEAAIDSLPYEFTFSELERTCPGASRETISRAVRQLRKKTVLCCVYVADQQ
jgi:CRP-like cAMP-binding protein